MRLDGQGVQTVLAALGEQLLQRTEDGIALVICGGSALQALGLVQRSTRDVDVLAIAQMTEGGRPLLLSAEPLPAVLVEAARIVQRDFNLPADWLNAGPTDLLTEGLPEGCVERLHTISYGERLIVHFIGPGRPDLPEELRGSQWG